MNREILFRGKKVDNGEWVEGSLLSINNKTEQESFRFIIPEQSNGSHVGNIMKFVNPCFKVHISTVGQFTGLLDKNGKKIFEGDMFIDCGRDHYVEYIEDYCQYVLTTGRGYDSKNCIGLSCDVVFDNEIIGTIHDQPKSEG